MQDQYLRYPAKSEIGHHRRKRHINDQKPIPGWQKEAIQAIQSCASKQHRYAGLAA